MSGNKSSRAAVRFTELLEVFERLHGPDGCPWDRRQTHRSLLPKLREEVLEVEAAVRAGDAENLREELGDLLLLVIFNGLIADRSGRFTVEDIITGLTAKLKRRHPHVFGSERAGSARAALLSYRRAKRLEKKAGAGAAKKAVRRTGT